MDHQKLVDIRQERQFICTPDSNSELGSVLPLPPELENIDVKHIVRQARGTPMFVCEPHGGTFVWRYIPLNHPDVKRFLRNREPTSDLPLADMRTWVRGLSLLSSLNHVKALANVTLHAVKCRVMGLVGSKTHGILR